MVLKRFLLTSVVVLPVLVINADWTILGELPSHQTEQSTSPKAGVAEKHGFMILLLGVLPAFTALVLLEALPRLRLSMALT